jgi:hypothetical protein
VADSDTELSQAYYEATKSPRKDALHPTILAACAIAAPDEFGYFRPSAIQGPLNRILKKKCQPSTYNDHLREFTEDERGGILERSGHARSWRYRFRNPMIQPFVLMKSYAMGLLTLDLIVGRPDSTEPQQPSSQS